MISNIGDLMFIKVNTNIAPTNEESAWHREENLGEEKNNLRVGVALRLEIFLITNNKRKTFGE